MKSPSLVPLVLKALALAMSVAVVVLGVVGGGTPQTFTNLLGIGLLALSIWALQTGN